MAQVMAAVIEAVYDRLTGYAALDSHLGTSWIVQQYPDDPAIEAQGVYDQPAQSETLPYIVVGDSSWHPNYEAFNKVTYSVNLQLIVWNKTADSLSVLEILEDVEAALSTKLTVTGFNVIAQSIGQGWLRRQSNFLWFATIDINLYLE